MPLFLMKKRQIAALEPKFKTVLKSNPAAIAGTPTLGLRLCVRPFRDVCLFSYPIFCSRFMLPHRGLSVKGQETQFYPFTVKLVLFPN